MCIVVGFLCPQLCFAICSPVRYPWVPSDLPIPLLRVSLRPLPICYNIGFLLLLIICSPVYDSLASLPYLLRSAFLHTQPRTCPPLTFPSIWSTVGSPKSFSSDAPCIQCPNRANHLGFPFVSGAFRRCFHVFSVLPPLHYLMECVRCHAIKYKIKNYATDKVKKLWYCRK